MQTSNNKAGLIILSLMLLISANAHADDYHYVNMVVGHRASGMGGAYTALSDDTAGCYYNPAGTAYAASESLSASVNAISTSVKTYKDALTGVDGVSYDWEQESSSLLPNFFGILKKLGPGILGLSYAVPDSIIRRQKQHFSNIGSVFPDNEIDSYIININDSDKVYLFGPSYAYNFSDSFSMGATLYVYYRDMEFVRNQLLMFSQGEHYFINYYETKKEWGCKPILGFIYEPFDRLALGFTISKIAIRSSDNEQQTIFRDTISTDYSNTNTINYSRAKNSEENEFPTTFCLGIAYFFSPRLLLSTDFTFHKEISDKESVINVSLGTEFYFTDTMAIRAGFFTDNSNTPVVSSAAVNQNEHINILGLNLSISRFNRNSSITLGLSGGIGSGDAQIIMDSTTIQDVDVKNLTAYISSSYNY